MKFNFNNQQQKIISNENSQNTEKNETPFSFKFNFSDKKQENNQNKQEIPVPYKFNFNYEKQDDKTKYHDDKLDK